MLSKRHATAKMNYYDTRSEVETLIASAHRINL
jgi:hypothetical protein